MAIGIQPPSDSVLAHAIAEALRDETESRADAKYLAGIRRLFSEPRETYTVDELASLRRIAIDDVLDVFHDELTVSFTPSTPRIARADALSATVAFSIVRPIDIERALVDEFPRIRQEAWRTVPAIVHIPRFIADAMTRNEGGTPRSLAAAIEALLTDCFHHERMRQRGSRRL